MHVLPEWHGLGPFNLHCFVFSFVVFGKPNCQHPGFQHPKWVKLNSNSPGTICKPGRRLAMEAQMITCLRKYMLLFLVSTEPLPPPSIPCPQMGCTNSYFARCPQRYLLFLQLLQTRPDISERMSNSKPTI